MGVKSTSATDWMHGFGQGRSEGSSGTVDRADEWCLKEPRAEGRSLGKSEPGTLKHVLFIPASL